MADTTDASTIDTAYQDELKQMFTVLFESSVSDGLDDAAGRFSNGLTKLRAARDRAKQIVNGSASPSSATNKSTK
jgi:hypothetical protein